MIFTEEQRAKRRNGIGGSELASIVGRSPYSSALGVYLRKVGEEEHLTEETGPQLRGRILEPAILSWFEETRGAVLDRNPESFQHPKHPILFASPDAIARMPDDERLVVEAKTVHFRQASNWGPAGTDEIPEHYLIQVQAELACTGLQRAELPVLIAGEDFRIYNVEFEPELFGVLVQAAEKFWRDHVIPRKPPPLDGSDEGDSWLRRRFPGRRGRSCSPQTRSSRRLRNDSRRCKPSCAPPR